MEYRTVRPAEDGYASEAEQEQARHGQIQYTMATSGPNDLLDTLLVVANVCENRALVMQDHPELGPWYDLMGILLRNALELTSRPGGPKADGNLENPALYFADVEHMH